MILDADTLQPAAAVDVLLRGASGLELPGTLKTEMHASVVELDHRHLRRRGRGGGGAAGAATRGRPHRRGQTGSRSPRRARIRPRRSSRCRSSRRSATSR